MSYLNMPLGLPGGASKAVISLWFRVPQETLDNAVFVGGDTLLDAVAPLLVMGPVGYRTDFDVHVSAPIPIPPPNILGETYMTTTTTSSGPVDMDPTVIGVFCGYKGGPRFYLNLQTGVSPSVHGVTYDVTGVSQHNRPSEVYDYDFRDSSAITQDMSAAFTTGFPPDDQFMLAADQWHHVIVSFEILPCIANGWDGKYEFPEVVSTAKMWIALDDVNFSESDLSPNWPSDGGPNDILTFNAKQTKASAPPHGRFGMRTEMPRPQYEAQCSSINGAPLGAPATVQFVEHIRKVETAELQIFTGITLDTGVESNRRAFIDYQRDSTGKPTKDQDGKLTLQPVNPSTTEEKLGKRPDVLLHGTNNWKAGKNTGSIGLKRDPVVGDVIIEAGQFTPTGLIKPYKPDPTLQQTPPPP